MRFATLLVSVLLAAPAAHAQLAAVRLGAKVRIETMDVDNGQVVGTVVLRSRDVITIRRPNRELQTFSAAVGLASISSQERGTVLTVAFR